MAAYHFFESPFTMSEYINEDAPINQSSSQPHHDENYDATDEPQDYRFLAALTSNPDGKHTIPKRGEKDFEPHGTLHQASILDASRQAMHDALDHTRVHGPKAMVRAWYFGDGVQEDDSEALEENVDLLSEAVRGRGLERDRTVMVEHSRGTHFRTMGKTALGTKSARLWLLPEEALYLVERGSLDLWWPSAPLKAMNGATGTYGEEGGEEDGMPLSLQACYSLLVGEGEGLIQLERFQVYANLKRTGYVVNRAPPPTRAFELEGEDLNPSTMEQREGLLSWLVKMVMGEKKEKKIEHLHFGPLVRPGLYRSYNDMYRQLSIIPVHKPKPTDSPREPSEPYKLAFHLWKPARIPTFAKSAPGMPDFRICVVDARETSVPSLDEITALLESTPWDPPNPQGGDQKSYVRLKHGWRNVILAVVDQGIISYLNMTEGAFGEERLHERFDRGGVIRGGKRGGGRGRRGSGRGGGRGRGK